jgi:hypothetical protein
LTSAPLGALVEPDTSITNTTSVVKPSLRGTSARPATIAVASVPPSAASSCGWSMATTTGRSGPVWRIGAGAFGFSTAGGDVGEAAGAVRTQAVSGARRAVREERDRASSSGERNASSTAAIGVATRASSSRWAARLARCRSPAAFARDDGAPPQPRRSEAASS